LTVGATRNQELYAGVRLTVPAGNDRAQVFVRLDISAGDPVTPGPAEVTYPALLGGSICLLGYPLATAIAEKVVTMIYAISPAARGI
jgi:hypothetical protein